MKKNWNGGDCRSNCEIEAAISIRNPCGRKKRADSPPNPVKARMNATELIRILRGLPDDTEVAIYDREEPDHTGEIINVVILADWRALLVSKDLSDEVGKGDGIVPFVTARELETKFSKVDRVVTGLEEG